MRIRIIPLVITASFVLIVAKTFEFSSKNNSNQTEALAADKETENNNNTDNLPPQAFDGTEEATLSPNYSGSGPKQLDINNLSKMELNLLESLSKRRDELEKWDESISMKENILNATEKKINRKLEELKKLKMEVSDLLKEYTKKENKKVQRLVKIYENMKAQDAANIFADMEEHVVLDVIGKMKEAKAAKVLSKMNPVLAEEITEKLAQQRRLSTKNR